MTTTGRLASVLLLTTFVVLHAPAALAQVTPVPPGYGNYCSVIYGGGPWDFKLGQTANSDPCAGIVKLGTRITRAGLWKVEGGENNILIRCDPLPGKTLPQLFPDRGRGDSFINKKVDEAKNKGLKNCIVTLAPVALPVFSRPYGTTPGQSTPDADVNKIFVAGFNFDSHFDEWDVAEFGQDLSKAGNTAVSFDRFGRQQQRRGLDAECTAAMQPPGCSLPSRTGSDAECKTRGSAPGCVYTQTFEPAYDWTMPTSGQVGLKPLVAVADGKVLWAGTRDVSVACPTVADTNQKEIYIEHQVGSNKYAERFVTIYYHLDKFISASGGPNAPLAAGTQVVRGQTIGFVGSTGCSGGAHLDFRVVRLTNLSGGRSFKLQVQLPTNPVISGIPGPLFCAGAIVCQTAQQGGYGSNGLAGHIDPFGWAAPKGIDPWAWKAIGEKDRGLVPFPSGVTDFGAFSINLWIPGQAPPTYWTDFEPVYRQGDPGNGIGGYDLADAADQVFAFDFKSSGNLDHLVLYRPGKGTIWILKNTNGAFIPVLQQAGIGGYDLADAADRVFAFDFKSSGKLDHLVLYRPGKGVIFILQNTNGAFTPVFPQGAPGNGIGGYDLADAADRVFAFDFKSSGKLDHLVLYRPGKGTIWILKNTNGAFIPVLQQGTGIGGYDLADAADRVFAFDFKSSGKLDHLVLYRPGKGAIWILKSTNGAFIPVLQQGTGIGGYDLVDAADRVFAFDYNRSGNLDHLVLYRPGKGTIWILRNNNDTTFDWVYRQGDPGNGIGGYDLADAADQVFAFDFKSSGNLDHLVLYRPGTGTIWILKGANSG